MQILKAIEVQQAWRWQVQSLGAPDERCKSMLPPIHLVDYSPLEASVCRGTDFVIVRELAGGILPRRDASLVTRQGKNTEEAKTVEVSDEIVHQLTSILKT
ncbi:unnamed protein product [Clonostachys byssicola]|uniref:Uncharacterized protein n=1 Tax=Clonostachys byssicola TaxID=160290 RepID=A0A9N9U295_9HYPO|nr:unnamed protein product [Clonostachys byssicola]